MVMTYFLLGSLGFDLQLQHHRSAAAATQNPCAMQEHRDYLLLPGCLWFKLRNRLRTAAEKIAMNPDMSYTKPSASDTAVEQISRSTGKNAAVVQEIYDRTLQSLTNGARVTQFIHVIAIRRTLIELGKQH